MSPTRIPRRLLSQRIAVPVGSAVLTATLTEPADPRALVLVPSASGDRTSDRANRAVTSALWDAGFATVEVDLLTRQEARDDAEHSALRFDLDLIAGRIAATLEWAKHVPGLQSLEVGVFAAGTCTAGALVAAAERRDLIQSIVCRSARPELAAGALTYVQAPVLLLLGERDIAHRDEHAVAMTLLPPRSRLAVIPNARHLLDRPADVRRVAGLAITWFGETLASRWVAIGTWTGPVRELIAR
jgi:putative phosphoribosyl transferase